MKEAATRGVLCKKVFLEISENSQENTCEFCEISKNTFFTEHLWTTASNMKIFAYEYLYSSPSASLLDISRDTNRLKHKYLVEKLNDLVTDDII